MVSNHVVKFLVNKDQFERLRNNASQKGFKTISAYIREVSIDRDFRVEQMISEIHRKVLKDERHKKYERSKESGSGNSRMGQYYY